MNRLTNWRPGDVVRTLVFVRQHARPGAPLPDGSIGQLGELYRIQRDCHGLPVEPENWLELWAFWQGAKLSTIYHTAAERCFGPVRWTSCFSGE